ncbi:nonstructural protein NSP1 [Human rotavirus A]|uniref:Non-structural protein 1 n=1 Tax=Human rotavirus A TaxID=10941 RepID=F1B1E6_9REOV|nr:nonstructural protein NSP1 [Human rotavirus A]
MATFKDACYYYKKLNKLNSLVLKLGANDEWRPAPVTKYKGWCLDCCQYTDLTYCRGCALYHVCQWCSQYNRCFLDEEPHLLRMRTFKDVITKEDIEGLLTMYEILFPINEKLVNKFINSVKQRKCRTEYLLEWYNHLLMPITLQALTIKLEDSTYYIFGYYDCMEHENQTPFQFINLLEKYDKLLLDDRNFNRMLHLPTILQQEYALRYFSKSRFLSKGKKRLNRNDFSDNLVEDRHSPTSLIQVVRNCISTHPNDYEWNKACTFVVDARNYINIMNSSYTEHYSVSQRCKLFTKYKFGIISKLVKPNYIFSSHESCALNVHNCRWCQINSHYKVWEDFRLKKIYNNVMDFIRALVKSNTSIGHCSSQESVYIFMLEMFLICEMKKWNEAVEVRFNCLDPVDINGTYYVLLDYEVNWEVRGLVMQSMDGKIPRILNLNDANKLLITMVFDWFDIRYMRETPMTTLTVNKLRTLNKRNELIDEYDLELSDVE